jgi:hypothetical protein
MQTVAEFVAENFYGGGMETEEFIWALIAKVSSAADKETLRRMYFGDAEMEEIAALALTMN